MPPIQQILNKLQDQIRMGDIKARLLLQNMIVYQAYCHSYKRLALYCTMDNNMKTLELDMFPDIYIYYLRAMCTTCTLDDEFVNFIKSSVPFFANPRRMQKKHAWSDQNVQGISILLRCCMPTLLSLFPILSSKDVHFWARVHIYRLFMDLLQGSQKNRCLFFENNRALLRVCLIEYVLYFSKFVSPPPRTLIMQNVDINTLYVSAFNVAQQLRVDINTDYVLKFDNQDTNVTNADIYELLRNMNARCQVYLNF
jgi:hypothetical protein